MKISKKNLKTIVKNYLNEVDITSLPVGPEGGVPGRQYPEDIVTPEQKRMYDFHKSADRRRIEHPDSKAGLKWPQSFVIFEEEFAQHIADWRLFKRVHPNWSLALQIFDLSGVSGYSDLADSIENYNVKQNPTFGDDLLWYFDFIGSLPIGLLGSLGSGRIGLKAINASIQAFKNSKTLGKIKFLRSILKASGKYGELFTPENIKIIFEKLASRGIKVSKKAVESITKKIVETCNILDSFAFRALDKILTTITKNMGDELGQSIIKYLLVRTAAPDVKKAAQAVLKTAPEQVKNFVLSRQEN